MITESLTKPELTLQDYQVIQSALRQRVDNFLHMHASCYKDKAKKIPQKPDALVANYAVVGQVFFEQAEQAQELLDRVETLMENWYK